MLVVGGDGTIGWILSVLDKLQQQFAAQEEPWHWALPPVAVLPLGTGEIPSSHVTPHVDSVLHIVLSVSLILLQHGDGASRDVSCRVPFILSGLIIQPT